MKFSVTSLSQASYIRLKNKRLLRCWSSDSSRQMFVRGRFITTMKVRVRAGDREVNPPVIYY